MITTEKVKLRLDPDDITIEQAVYNTNGPKMHQFLITKLIEEAVKEVPYHYNIKYDYMLLMDVIKSYLPFNLKSQLNHIINNYNKIINDFIECCRIVHEDEIIRFLCCNSVLHTPDNRKFKQLFQYNCRRERLHE